MNFCSIKNLPCNLLRFKVSVIIEVILKICATFVSPVLQNL